MSDNVSPPFALREANGRLLLEELNEMRDAGISPIQLSECAVAVRDLSECSRYEAMQQMAWLQKERFAPLPAVAGLLKRWSDKVKTDGDVQALVAHFERLALVASVLFVLRRGGEG